MGSASPDSCDDPSGSRAVRRWLLAVLAPLRVAEVPLRAFDRAVSLRHE
jgi:hypothetical protein